MPKSRRAKQEQVWQNACLWEKEPTKKSSSVMGGYLNITVDFLEEILEKVESGEIELGDEDRVELGISFRENSSPNSDSSPDYLGNIFILNQEEEEKPARRKRSRRRDEEDEEEDDEPVRRRKRRSSSREEEDTPPSRRRRSTSSSSGKTRSSSRRASR